MYPPSGLGDLGVLGGSTRVGSDLPSYTFTVPDFLPVRLNVLLRAHWSKRNRLLKDDSFLIGLAFRASGIPPAEGRRRLSVCYRSPRPPRDADASLKGLLDALVACRALRDDSPAWCELGRLTFDVGPRATVIGLEDLL
jgi:hypothetical protein